MSPGDRRGGATGVGTRAAAVGRRPAPTPAAADGGRFVVLDALREALDGADWAPLRLAGSRRERPTSPRLPHALALHLACEARAQASPDGGAVSIAATDVPVDAGRLEALLGADRPAVSGALAALAHAGVLDLRDGAPPAGSACRFAAAVLGPEPRCAALDWRAIATATAGSPTAWVAAHALAERLDVRDWTPVPRGALEVALGCGVSGVRGALERLVTSAIVERREQRGGVSVFRFTDQAWGRGGSAVTPAVAASGAPAPSTPVAARVVVPPSAGVVAAAPPAASRDAAGGVRLMIGGVELELPPGCRAQVAIGADGRPIITLAGAPSEG